MDGEGPSKIVGKVARPQFFRRQLRQQQELAEFLRIGSVGSYHAHQSVVRRIHRSWSWLVVLWQGGTRAGTCVHLQVGIREAGLLANSHLGHLGHVEAKEVRFVDLLKSDGAGLIALGGLLPFRWLMNDTALSSDDGKNII